MCGHGSLPRVPGPGSNSPWVRLSFGAVEVLNRAIAEIAPLDVDILVTVGPEGEPAALGGAGQRARRTDPAPREPVSTSPR